MSDSSDLSPEQDAHFREKGYLQQTPEVVASMKEAARKLYAELEPDLVLLNQRAAEARENWTKLFSRNHDAIGRVLKHHLILEYHITKHLEALAPQHDWKRARLRFAQKVELIPKGNAVIESLIPGIREVNAARNALSHEIDAQPSLERLKSCCEALKSTHPYSKNLYSDAIVVIEDFTALVCSWLPTDADILRIFGNARERVDAQPPG